MINAMAELLDKLKQIGYEPKQIGYEPKQIGYEPKQVKCAIIGMKSDWHDLNINDLVLGRGCLRRAVLVEDWNNDQWLSFLEGLNFNYDGGYGTQYLYGVVWFKDGTWLERAEYDGSEWWVHEVVPEIPSVLLRTGE